VVQTVAPIQMEISQPLRVEEVDRPGPRPEQVKRGQTEVRLERRFLQLLVLLGWATRAGEARVRGVGPRRGALPGLTTRWS
jgi:hypothetical protein